MIFFYSMLNPATYSLCFLYPRNKLERTNILFSFFIGTFQKHYITYSPKTSNLEGRNHLVSQFKKIYIFTYYYNFSVCPLSIVCICMFLFVFFFSYTRYWQMLLTPKMILFTNRSTFTHKISQMPNGPLHGTRCPQRCFLSGVNDTSGSIPCFSAVLELHAGHYEVVGIVCVVGRYCCGSHPISISSPASVLNQVSTHT